MSSPQWIESARNQLLQLFNPGVGWGYKPEGSSFVEPTALACLALQATDSSATSGAARTAQQDAAQWLMSVQQPNGAVGISAQFPKPEWPTPYAILVWANRNGFDRETKTALDWLQKRQGLTSKREPGNVVGHDPSIAGWPWVAETHSWLEPTAMAVLALRRAGLRDSPRTRDGIRLIRDRAIATGGWNYGNNLVYGTDLRPQPAATGIALAALGGAQKPDDIVEKGCAYLRQSLPSVRSAQSLSWGLLGLTAWDLRPPDTDQWLAQAFELAVRRPDPGVQLAYLLLAASDTSLHLLGVR